MPASIEIQEKVRGALSEIVEAILDLELDQLTTNIADLGQVTLGILGQLQATNSKLDGVISAIGNIKSGGGGCGGCGGGTGTVISLPPIDGQPGEGGGPGGGGVPDTYNPDTGTGETDEEKYSRYKCKAANFVLDQIVKDLRFLGGLSGIAGAVAVGEAFGELILASVTAYAASTVGVIGVSVFAVLTGWEIAIIVAAIAGLSVLAGTLVIGLFTDIADDFEAKKADMICDVYEAQSVESARTVISDALTASVSSFSIPSPFDEFGTAIRSAISGIIGYFIPNGLLNCLFSNSGKYANIEEYVSENDISCDSCDEFVVWWSCMTNDETGYAAGDVDWVEVEAIASGSNYILSIGYATLVDWTVTVTSGGFTSPSSWPSDFNYAADEASGTVCGSGNGYGWTTISSTWDLSPTNKKTLQYVSGSPFRMRFDRIDP